MAHHKGEVETRSTEQGRGPVLAPGRWGGLVAWSEPARNGRTSVSMGDVRRRGAVAVVVMLLLATAAVIVLVVMV